MTAEKAIIPNRAAISQLIRNDSAADRRNRGRSRRSAIKGTLTISEPMIRIGSIFWKTSARMFPISSAKYIPKILTGFIMSVATVPFTTLISILRSTFVISSTDKREERTTYVSILSASTSPTRPCPLYSAFQKQADVIMMMVCMTIFPYTLNS